MERHTVAVVGATGFVGSHIVEELLNRGHAVRALVRDPSKGARALPTDHEGLTLVAGSPDSPTLDSLCDGATACVNAAGIIREAPGGQTFESVHVRLTERLLASASRAGAGRFVLISALGISPEGPSVYQTTKWRAEQAVRVSGLEWTIFRPGLIVGRGSGFVDMARSWVTGRAAPFVFLPYFTRRADGRQSLVPGKTVDPKVQPIAVEDIAQAVASSLMNPESAGEIYPLAGPEVVTVPELLVSIRDAVPLSNPRLKPRGVPGPLAAAVARVAKPLGLRDALPFDEGMALMGAADSVTEVDKARAHLDFAPRECRAEQFAAG